MSLSKLNINSLPNEILVEIFGKLESPQVSICMMVNKKWNGILRGREIGIEVYGDVIRVAAEWAAYNGNMDLLKFAKINFRESRLCEVSSRGGQLNTLKWARENGCPWDKNECLWNIWTFSCVEIGDHQGILKWIRENEDALKIE